MKAPSVATPKHISAASVECRLGTPWRVRARRRRRGSMFVEAMSVAMISTFLLICVVRFHSVYSTAAEALAASRLAALQRAYAGCELEAADKVLEIIGRGTSRVPGMGAFPTAIRHDIQTRIACNEPRARDEPSLAPVLNYLRQFVDLKPVEMLTWLSGASELFPGMSAAVNFVGTAVGSFSQTISNANSTLADRLGDVLSWVQEAVVGAFEWVTSLF